MRLGRESCRPDSAARCKCVTALGTGIICLEDQANASWTVRDVGIICSLTCADRDWPGWLLHAVATGWAALGPGHPSDRYPLNPCHGRSSPALRVHVPVTLTVRGCPAITDGLDAELARLQDRAPEGWSLATSRASAGSAALGLCRWPSVVCCMSNDHLDATPSTLVDHGRCR
jgi:hypothetical protein